MGDQFIFAQSLAWLSHDASSHQLAPLRIGYAKDRGFPNRRVLVNDGLHLAICWVVGFLLGLNRLKMYFAANVSNPFVAPWLVYFAAGTLKPMLSSFSGAVRSSIRRTEPSGTISASGASSRASVT